MVSLEFSINSLGIGGYPNPAFWLLLEDRVLPDPTEAAYLPPLLVA